MGGLCSCLGDNKQQTYEPPTPKTPLLSNIPSSSTAADNDTKSARKHRPDIDKEKQFLTSLEQLSPVIVGDLPIPSLDKTFKDHAKLYNDLLEKFYALKEILNDFKGLYEKQTNGIPTLKVCMKLMSDSCGGEAKITAKRTKHSVQLEYDVRNVSNCCKQAPEDVIESLALYNKANALIRKIMEKTPHVKDSIQLILQDEEQLRKNVTKEHLSGTEGPEAVKTCARNINNLRSVPGDLDTIKKYTDKSFKDLVESSTDFFADRDIK